MKKAVVTVAVGRSRMWKWTHPLMQRYADRIGAEFVAVTGPYVDSKQSRLKKFEIYRIFDRYDRMIYVDGDMAIHPRCPDLFEMVPGEKIGAVREGPPYSADRSEVLRQACEYYGVPFPSYKAAACAWFNSGLMVLSRCHRNLFIRPSQSVKTFGEGWVDMPLLNSQVIKYGYELHDLGLKFNYMGSLVSHKNRPFEPVDSYIFHATGFLRWYRMHYLKLVIRMWCREYPGEREKARAYRRNFTVLSYKLYERLRANASYVLKHRFKPVAIKPAHAAKPITVFLLAAEVLSVYLLSFFLL